MGNIKIQEAAAVTDKVVTGFNEAKDRLQVCYVNGAGVLSDPSDVRRDLVSAKAAIDEALNALEGFRDWPKDADYDD